MKTDLEPIGSAILSYYEEAKQAKMKRMAKNQDNFDAYNLNADFSHKKAGQSQEFLPKQQMAVEQLVSFLTQGLVDKAGWFDVTYRPHYQPKILTAPQWKDLLKHFVDKSQFDAFVQDSFKVGLLGALMICKIDGESYEDLKYEVKSSFLGKSKLERVKRKYWRPKVHLIRQENYFKDPTGRDLYEIEAMEMDWHDLYQIAQQYPEDYDLEVVQSLQGIGDSEQEHKKARETNQSISNEGSRRRIRVYECWGTVYGQDGMPLMENSVCTVTEDGRVIRRAKKIDLWDGESPYVTCPIVRVPHSVWHRALMDGATAMNLAENEIFNLILDGGIMSVHGIKQIRSQWLANPEEIDEGIAPGQTLETNSSMPPGAKVIERVDTGAVAPESVQVFQIVDREFQNASMTSDIRMGNLPQRQVKATEIVASNQTQTGIQTGFVKYVEKNYIERIIHKMSCRIAENMSKLCQEDLEALFGEDTATKILGYSNEEIFAEYANGAKIQVFGMTSVMDRITDFRKIQGLLQVIGGSPDLMREFQLNFSTAKVLGEIIKSLNIDLEKIKASPDEQARAKEMIMAQMKGAQKDGMSQVPDQAGQTDRTEMDNFQSGLQQGISSEVTQ